MNFLKPTSTILFIAACGLLISCGDQSGKTESAGETIRGVDTTYIDNNYKATDDFFLYANNGWLKNNPVPPSENAWGTFHLLRNDVFGKLKGILESSSGNKAATKGSSEQLIGDFYTSGMDSVSIESAGLTPLKEALDKINGIKDKKELGALTGYLHTHLIFTLFTPDINPDARKSDEIIVALNQGGLGLPDRDYYLRQDEKSKMIREKYIAHISRILMLMGESEPDAKKDAEAIMKIETAMAAASWTNVENRDPIKVYNKKSVQDLEKMCPAFIWTDYFAGTGIKNIDSLIIAQPSFFTGLNKIISSASLEDWKKYCAFGLVDAMSPRLSSAFENERFDFYDKTLTGTKQMKPRWKRVLTATDRSLGDALGKIFVDKHFPAEAKKRVTEMVENLIAAYKERITTRDWMGDSTKQQAIAKLDKIMKKFGYPDVWKDYKGLDISRDSYAKNSWNSNLFQWEETVNKLGKPVNRKEWLLSPPTINAYYNPNMNEIVFPAGIMQYPFFDINQDDALNYGAMGAVIGHELTHGFDDQGSLYDGDGNMKQWWTAQDNAKFKEKTEMISNQYSNYVAIDTLHVNGALTLGENIADLGGLTLAYYAYKKSLEGKESKTINGFTPEQRFFFGWAKGWCVNYTPEYLRQMVLTNVHAPGNFRVTGPLSNMQEFYDAFGVKEGDKMYRKPEERAMIW